MANKPAGTVFLVGAGPGDPDLLTVRACKLLKAAEVVVYDRLVSPEILSLVPRGAARIDVGKRPGSHPVPQQSINSILVRLARSGHNVIRLKGGDPMIFGRGGEEALALKRHGIEVVTVPGITAAQGCAASLNLPLTHRAIARSITYMTGSTLAGDIPCMDWTGLANTDTTLVIYMGVARITAITDRLIAAGMDPQTPAAAICNATLASQRHIYSTILKLAEDTRSSRFDGPVLFIIGQAAALAAEKGEPRNVVNQSTMAVAIS